MVITYLEKIKEKYQNELLDVNEELNRVICKRKENVEIIKLLQINEDPNYQAFTPRPVNSFNKTKISELKIEQDSIDKQIEILKLKIEELKKEIDEVCEVISVAKKCIL